MAASGLTVAHAAATQTGPTAEAATVGEVVVTAQRRSERLLDVPIAITSVSADQLASSGIGGATDLGLITPGLNFAVQGAFAQPTIRGIGTTVTGPGADANVSLYVDGVYQPNQTGNLFDFNNIERIDVLKGPQGTLFGRNATGGAITIKTRDPSSTPVGELSASYGSFNEIKVSGYGSTGIAPHLASDIAFLFKEDDGYVKNDFTGKEIARAHVGSVRSKLLFTPNENLRIMLSGIYSDDRDNSPFSVKPLAGNNNLASQVTIPTDPYHTALSLNPAIRTKSYGASLNISDKTAYGTFSSISSYERVEPYLFVDIDNTILPVSAAIILDPEKTTTQEFNFASNPMGAFSWIGGTYFYWDDAGIDLTATTGAPAKTVAHVVGRVKTDAEAVFAEGNYDVTSKLRLILGLRYSSEEKRALGTVAGLPIYLVNTQKRWDYTTPRASLKYAIDLYSNVYATYSEGFKSGNYNLSALSSTPANPEVVKSYEAGYKYARGRFSFNTSAYYYDYKNIQVQIQVNNNGVLSTVLQNAATANIYGLDADFKAQLTDNWRVDAGAAWTHARYDSYNSALITTPIFKTVNGVVYSNGNSVLAGSAGGNDMIRTPEFTGNVTLTYVHDLPVGSVEASGTTSYNGGFFWDPGNRVKQDAYTIVNAQISWLSSDRRLKLTAWGRNLADEKYCFYSNQTSTGDSCAIGRPLSVGLAASWKFN